MGTLYQWRCKACEWTQKTLPKGLQIMLLRGGMTEGGVREYIEALQGCYDGRGTGKPVGRRGGQGKIGQK